MSWPDARAALIGTLAAVEGVAEVLVAPPMAARELARDGVTVFLTPPGRRSERRPGGVTTRTVGLRLTVAARAGQLPEGAALAVDAAVEAIDLALEGAVALGGAATVAGPVSWSDAHAGELPPGSGVVVIAMDGSTDIRLDTTHDRRA